MVGVLAVELFETVDGELMVNELAMRPHNSGHWTMDGARTSQFEQHLRAVLGLSAGRHLADRTGDRDGQCDWCSIRSRRWVWTSGLHHLFARLPEAKVHLYGKGERPGRKIGHVNVLGAPGGSLDDDAYVADVRERAGRAAHWLSHAEWTDGWDEHA